MFVALILLGIVVFAALGWPLLRWIGRRYERKKLSDQSIMVDSICLLFGIVQSIGLAFEGALWMLTGLVAFAAYKLIAALRLSCAATLSHDATAGRCCFCACSASASAVSGCSTSCANIGSRWAASA